MKPIYLSLLALLPVGSAFSAVIYDFEGPDYVVQTGDNRTPLPASNWTQVGSNTVSAGVTYPISYTEAWSNVTGGSGTKSGAIGTAIANSADATVTAFGSLAGQGSILNTQISTTIAINDSNGGFNVRDSFGMEIRGAGNTSLASLTFTPENTDATVPGGWLISYTTASGTVQLASPIVALSEYNFSLTFLASGVELHYAPADNSSSNTVAFLPPGYDSSAVYQDIGFSVTQSGAPATWGNSADFLRFDNIAVNPVPEVSSFALAGVAALGFLRRRRA
ncbi:MAG: hypothetical protein JWO82_2532 [Akkermansiaceae bacterium]|nr:hypothetical protein [Akkermansiaceae bacterium]